MNKSPLGAEGFLPAGFFADVPLAVPADGAAEVPADVSAVVPAAVLVEEPVPKGCTRLGSITLNNDVWVMIVTHLSKRDLLKFALLCKAANKVFLLDQYKLYWYAKWMNLLALTNQTHPKFQVYVGNYGYASNFRIRLQREFFRTATMESKQECLNQFGRQVLLLDNITAPATITLDLPPTPGQVPAVPHDPNAPNPNQVHLVPMAVILAAGRVDLFEEFERTAILTFLSNQNLTVKPLTALSLFERPDVIVYLLQRFPALVCPNSPSRLTGTRTILEEACARGDTRLVTALLEHPEIQFTGEAHPVVRAYDSGNFAICKQILLSPSMKLNNEDKWYHDLLVRVMKASQWDLLDALLVKIFENYESTASIERVLYDCILNDEIADFKQLVTRCPDPRKLRAETLILPCEHAEVGKLPFCITKWVRILCEENKKILLEIFLETQPVIQEGELIADLIKESIGQKFNFLSPDELKMAMSLYKEGKCKFFPDLFKNPNQGLSTQKIAGELAELAHHQEFLQVLLNNPAFYRHDALREYLTVGNASYSKLETAKVIFSHPLTDVNLVLELEGRKRSLIEDCFRNPACYDLIFYIWKNCRTKLNDGNKHHIIRWAYQISCDEIVKDCDEALIRASGASEETLSKVSILHLLAIAKKGYPLPFSEKSNPIEIALASNQDPEEKVIFLVQERKFATDFRTKSGNTLLHECVERGYTNLMSLLLEINPALKSEENNDGQTALNLACSRQDWLTVETLYDEGQIRASLNTVNAEGVSLAHQLIDEGFVTEHPDLLTADSLNLAYQDCNGNNYAHILSRQADCPENLLTQVMSRAPNLMTAPNRADHQTPADILLSQPNCPPAMVQGLVFSSAVTEIPANNPDLKPLLILKNRMLRCMGVNVKLGFTQFLELRRQCSGQLETFNHCVEMQLAKEQQNPLWRSIMSSCLEPCEPLKTKLIDALLDYQKSPNGHHKRVDSLFVDLMKAKTVEELREVIDIQIRIHRGETDICDPSKGRHMEPMKHAKLHFRFWRLLKEIETMLSPEAEKKPVQRFCW